MNSLLMPYKVLFLSIRKCIINLETKSMLSMCHMMNEMVEEDEGEEISKEEEEEAVVYKVTTGRQLNVTRAIN